MIQKRILCDCCEVPISFGDIFILRVSKGFSSVVIEKRSIEAISEVPSEIHICSVGCLLRYISKGYTSQERGRDNEEV